MWVVCRFKDDNRLFITSRKSRNIMVNTLIKLRQPIESRVEKEFDTYGEAIKYKTEIELVDNKIKEL